MNIKLMNKYIFFTIILIFLSLQITAAFLFNQDAQAEQSQITTKDNFVLEFFYSDSCPSCIQKEPIIDEIEQYYGDKITISRLRYTENKEKFDDYGFKYLPVAVVKNTSSGYYTLFTFERITKENIKESIDFSFIWRL
jgi:thiol-disulfide isomerase/thioredoxin